MKRVPEGMFWDCQNTEDSSRATLPQRKGDNLGPDRVNTADGLSVQKCPRVDRTWEVNDLLDEQRMKPEFLVAHVDD